MVILYRNRFLSTPSARRATRSSQFHSLSWEFLSTPSARRATRNAAGRLADRPRISIHALCEEGDNSSQRVIEIRLNFYPRPLRGGRQGYILQAVRARIFLSTPSARRATAADDAGYRSASYFYPRPLRGGRRTIVSPSSRSTYFYPRPLRGGRPYAIGDLVAYNKFLSTPSARRATTRSRRKR